VTQAGGAAAPAKRVAVLGFDLESNRFAPVCGRVDFQARWYYRGAEIDHEARRAHPIIHGGLCGFYATMDAAGPWVPVPVLYTGSVPSGAVEEGFFKEVAADIAAGLQASLPLDGVYICEHGAAVATHTHDPDGELFEMVRGIVGPDVPIVATLDLHANISRRMVGSTDALIAFLTNPHVDQRERGAEAATALMEMMAGMRTTVAWAQIPVVAPTVTQLTDKGHPYGDLIALGQSKIDADVLNVSIMTGFSFSDTPKNSLSVVVTTRGKAEKAEMLAAELARAAWAERHRFKPRLTPLAEAAELARKAGADPASPPLLFADVADNPGGGGRGNTTFVLRAFHEAGVEGALLGVLCEPAVVEAAWAAGEGGRFVASFNAGSADAFARPFAAEARVVKLSDSEFVGRHGQVRDRTVRLGRAAAIAIDGLRVVVNAVRQQTFSPDYFAHFGLDTEAARSFVVKSRGHFRAGFRHIFPPERIFEIDVPGLTSPNLANFDWRHLPRPVFPLDPETPWAGADGAVPVWVGPARA